MQTYYKQVFSLHLFILIISSLNSTYAQVDQKLAQLDQFLVDAQSEIGFPGLAVAVIQDGEVIYRKETGFANLEDLNLGFLFLLLPTLISIPNVGYPTNQKVRRR